MSEIQLARLTQDTLELKAYINELTSKRDFQLAQKLSKKLNYLESRIAERMAA